MSGFSMRAAKCDMKKLDIETSVQDYERAVLDIGVSNASSGAFLFKDVLKNKEYIKASQSIFKTMSKEDCYEECRTALKDGLDTVMEDAFEVEAEEKV
jgi:hypothetical protein